MLPLSYILIDCQVETCEFVLPSEEGDGTITVPVDELTYHAVDGCHLITTEFVLPKRMEQYNAKNKRHMPNRSIRRMGSSLTQNYRRGND